jgi:hypothetical protein
MTLLLSWTQKVTLRNSDQTTLHCSLSDGDHRGRAVSFPHSGFHEVHRQMLNCPFDSRVVQRGGLPGVPRSRRNVVAQNSDEPYFSMPEPSLLSDRFGRSRSSLKLDISMRSSALAAGSRRTRPTLPRRICAHTTLLSLNHGAAELPNCKAGCLIGETYMAAAGPSQPFSTGAVNDSRNASRLTDSCRGASTLEWGAGQSYFSAPANSRASCSPVETFTPVPDDCTSPPTTWKRLSSTPPASP